MNPESIQSQRIIDADGETTAETATTKPNPASTTPYLPEADSERVHERWRRVQTEFVDDPRKSVSEAHQLVSDMVERIVETFTQERNELEGQWSKGADVSTEDLRVCLQRYRTFFERLLPLGDAANMKH
jgi:hypothetical protein